MNLELIVIYTVIRLYIVVPYDIYFRSLSELDSLRLTGEAGDKIRQVTERATLFRITSNAMINVGVSSFVCMFLCLVCHT